MKRFAKSLFGDQSELNDSDGTWLSFTPSFAVWDATSVRLVGVPHTMAPIPQEIDLDDLAANAAATASEVDASNLIVETDGPSPPLTKVFDGPNRSQSLNYVPPDPVAAVGPGNVVVAVNDAIAWYDKNGTQQSLQTLDAFFHDTDARDLFDPRVVYDQYTGHFFALADLVDKPVARIYVAESNTNDPTQGWHSIYFSDLISSGANNYWADYPTLAVDQYGVYITGNYFSLTADSGENGGAGGDAAFSPEPLPTGVAGGSSTRMFFLPKDLSTFTTYDPAAAVGLDNLTLQPATMFGNQSGAGLTGTFLVAYQQNNSGNDTLDVIRINNASSNASFTKTAINLGDISDTYLNPSLNVAPQPGGVAGLNVGESRVYSAVWRDGLLYATTEISVSGRALVHWFEVNTATMTLVDQGNVTADDLGAGTNTFYGAVTVNGAGQFAIGFSASSTNLYPGAYYALHGPGDPAGTMEGTQVLQAGLGPYSAVTGDGRNRWGDYTGAAIDPSDDRSFWFFNEYATSSQSQWATKVGKVTIGAAPVDDYAGNSSTTGQLVAGGYVQGSIETAGDRDWFRVQLTAGITYTIDLKGSPTSSGTLTDTVLYFYNSSGQLITSNDDFGGTHNSHLVYTPTSSGTFFLGAGAYNDGLTGTYTLNMTGAVADDYAGNTGTTGQLSAGGSVTGNIEILGDRDWFRIQLTTGNTYTIDLKGAPTGSGTLSDTVVYLYNGSGQLITSNDDFGGIQNSHLVYTPTSSGTYFLGAGAYNDGLAGTYTLSMSSVPLDDYAGNTSTAGQVSAGGSVTGNLETLGDRDWFSIQLSTSNTYTIDLRGAPTSSGTLSDTVLYLYDGSGQLIASNDDFGGITNSHLVFSPTGSGTYYLGAGAYNDGYTGTYSLSVSAVPITPDDYANALNDASHPFGQAAANATISGALEVAGDRDWFRVQLSAGSNYTFNLQGQQSGAGTLDDPYLRLYDSTGALLAQNDDIELGVQRESRLAFTATTSGIYYVEAGSFDDSSSGTYVVGVTLGSPDLIVSSISLNGTMVNYQVRNSGSGLAVYSSTGLYLSTDSTITTADSPLTARITPALGVGGADNESIVAPLGGTLVPGTYFLGVIADQNGHIGESNESNNASSGVPIILGDDNANTLTGTAGTDTLVGFGGNDAINGGLGVDTAVYSGNKASYTIGHAGGVVTVSGPDGTDTLTGVEFLKFADATVSIGAVHQFDFNGDGKADVLFVQPGVTFDSDYLWQMNDRAIAAQGGVDLFDKAFSFQVTGDFDGNGQSDVLFENPATGGVYEWQLDGTSIVSHGAVDVGDTTFHILGTADFTGDGKSDLLWRSNTGFVYEWQMNGKVDTPAAVGGLDTSWHVVGAGDFNGDGMADILLRNISATADNGAFFLWEMNGKNIIGQGGIERPPTTWVTLGTGDFNGDGKTDFAVRSASGPDTGAVWVYLMNGTTIASQGAAGIADPTTWHVQEIADLDGDGKDDILFRNDAGYFYSWDMNGTHIASEGLAGTEAGNWADPTLHVVGQHWDLV